MYASHLGVETGMAITMVAFSHSSPSLSLPPPLCPTKTHYIFSTPPHAVLHQFHRCRLHSSVTPISISNSNSNSNSPLIRASSSSSLSVSRDPMVPPYNVLITGSTKAERVESALQDLRGEFGEQHVWGTKCDVRQGDDVKNLVAFAKEKLKYIDIWINNAGSNAYSYKPLSEASDEDLIEVVTTNTLGLMICCREAIKMMLDQPRGGHIFNIDGAGSDGRPTPRFAAYGATKRSVVHLTKSLQAELRMDDVKNVIVHNLSPGMVTTDLLLSGASTKQAKFFINVLAEPAEVVVEYLVPNNRSVPANGLSKPTYIRFLTGLKAYSQIFSRFAFGARRNRYLLED
ncbi:chlorophyll(ide) b reductase NOL, chloroplastic-like isoform X3 [Camellia sinensis]|uniref:chlorophyll(ide) b reductase NOL, chloroplastic-like isoform X3 n=1 Tax=Camellia sinensis TaxID=4442 RepID=UPI0010366A55|nr:chlorophyll(ide) b reductase NOL, chloroplastic-like isoform X3 [Camellia sinensis]